MTPQIHRRKARFSVPWVRLRPTTAEMAVAMETYIVGRRMHRPPIVPLDDLTGRPRTPALTGALHTWINTAATTHMLMAHMDSSRLGDSLLYATIRLGAILASRTRRTILNKVLASRKTSDFLSWFFLYSVQLIPKPGRHTSSAKQRNYVFRLDLQRSLAVLASYFTVLCVYSFF